MVLICYSSLQLCLESNHILSSYSPENVLPMNCCSTVLLQPVTELSIILQELEFFA